MIKSFCELLHGTLDEVLEEKRAALERGTGAFASDERLRGEIWGLRLAKDTVELLEERARRSESGDSDD
jgi:hypothetical protein